MNKKILYLFLCISSIVFSQQTPVVTAQIDTTNIRIGEQFELQIRVRDTANVIIPKLEDINGIEIIEDTKIDTIKNQLIKKYILTSFDSGSYYIPQQHIFIKQRLHLTDSLLIKVATIAVDTTQQKMFPIKANRAEPIIFDDYKKYVWLGIVVLVLLGILIYLALRKKKEPELEENVPFLPPLEEAIQKLQELDKKLLWQNNQIKAYYSELTEIVRGFIERELKVPALESTTDELIETLTDFRETKSITTTQDALKKLHDLLREADFVKFAKSKPLATQIELNRKEAEEIVTALQPEEEMLSENKTTTDELE